jgi:transposase
VTTEQVSQRIRTPEATTMTRPSKKKHELEVLAKPERRTFTTAYKLKVIQDVESLESGETGAYLRREGLYNTHLSKWRQAYREGRLVESAPIRRGPKPAPADPVKEELKRTQRELAKAQEELRKARLIIDVQKKLSQLLGVEMPSPVSDERGDTTP